MQPSTLARPRRFVLALLVAIAALCVHGLETRAERSPPVQASPPDAASPTLVVTARERATVPQWLDPQPVVPQPVTPLATVRPKQTEPPLVAVVEPSAAVVQDEPAPGENRAPGPITVTRMRAAGGTFDVVASELLVRFRSDVDSAQIRDFHAAFGTETVQRSTVGDVRRLRVPADADLATVMAQVRRDPRIKTVGPNSVARGAGCVGLGCHQFHIYGVPAENRFPNAWPIVKASKNVVVAIVDSGYRTLSELSHIPVLGGYDFVNADFDPEDDHNHGTHLATILGAHPSKNDTGMMGTNRRYKLMPIKVLDHNNVGTEMTVIEGIGYAVDHGADVINLSLSFPTGYVPSDALTEAVVNAGESGVVMVAASGNEGLQSCTYPAAFAEVIAVGASRRAPDGLVRAEYSNYGPTLDVLAPGGSFAHDLNSDGLPDAVLSGTFDPETGAAEPWLMAGTSQATAQATGLIALMLQTGTKPKAIRNILVKAAMGLEVRPMRPGTAVEMAKLHPGMTEDVKVFVNSVIALTETPDGTRAIVRLEAVDRKGDPMVDVRVNGQFGGVILDDKFCWTDAHGRCTMMSDPLPDGVPASVSFEAARVRWIDDTKHSVVPRRFYRLPESAANDILTEGSGLGASSLVLFEMDPAQGNYSPLFGDRQIAHSYFLQPLGTGLGASSMVWTFDLQWFNYLNTSFLGPTGSGLGASSLVFSYQPHWFFPSMEVPQLFGSGLGASSMVFVKPWQLTSPTNQIFWSSFGAGLGASSLVFDPGAFLYLPPSSGWMPLSGFGGGMGQMAAPLSGFTGN